MLLHTSKGAPATPRLEPCTLHNAAAQRACSHVATDMSTHAHQLPPHICSSGRLSYQRMASLLDSLRPRPRGAPSWEMSARTTVGEVSGVLLPLPLFMMLLLLLLPP